MTNSEAINLLDNLLGMVEDNHGSDYDMALRMAIDALKQPERITGSAVYQAGYADGYNSAQLERKTGKWIRITQVGTPEKYMCPFCHRTVEHEGVEYFVSMMYPFCHCGAKMEGEQP